MNRDNIHSVAILGSGETGRGAMRLAHSKGLRVFLSDSGKIEASIVEEMKTLGVDFEQNAHTLSKIAGYDIVVKSPGIPNKAQIIVDLKLAAIPIISEIEFASYYTGAKIIGITGSNGKTTTTLLTTHLLKSGGINVYSGGNLGNSFSQLILDHTSDIIVLELSSFQLDDIDTFKPNLALITNITPDHLDRYSYDMDKYAEAKMRLLKNTTSADTAIVNTDDPILSDKLSQKKWSVDLLSISTKTTVKNGAYVDGDHIVFDTKEGIHLLPIVQLPLIGLHNLYNQMMAITAALLQGVSLQNILDGLRTFVNAPHRLERIAEVDGVLFINDSKATNVDSVFYALDAMDSNVIWIAGGVNKGNDYSQIKHLVQQKVKGLICLGKDNRHLTVEFGTDVRNIVEVDSAEKAVVEAMKMAKNGDVVLLSPACASFDLFNNYEHRGELFRMAVLSLKSQQESKQIVA